MLTVAAMAVEVHISSTLAGSHSMMKNLKMALHNLPALERITGLQLLPSLDSPNLDTEHLLIPILGLEIPHTIRLLNPRVPHHRVFKVVARDVEACLPALDNGRGVDFDRFVHTVHFAGDAHVGVGLLVLGGVEDLVDVRDASEAAGFRARDVLQVHISIVISLA